MSRILMISSEAAPFAKTGGLADVVGALPTALESLGDRAAVVIPRYGSIDLRNAKRVWEGLMVHFGPAVYETTIYQATAPFPMYLVDCPPLFDREFFYGENGVDYPDNHIRFAVFARAALGVARHIFLADILHCHDWQAGLVPAYLRSTFRNDPTFLGCRTLFTIHNLAYQGLFPRGAADDVGLDWALLRPEGMEFYGYISYIKAGVAFSDAISTVSPTYAREIQTPHFGVGLDGALRARATDLSGILNGVDYDHWSPEADGLLPAKYSAADLSGKTECKRLLLAEFGLPAEALDRPVLGLISRFAWQKGVDLIADAAPEMVGMDTCLVALGTGDPELEERFRQLQRDFPGRIAVRIGFDNGLAHRIEAGADIFLMPSRYEPCGLNQIYSLRYGTVPVVRATGGLDDTIDIGTGFKFAGESAADLIGTLRAAVHAYADRVQWQKMMRLGMQRDFSWRASAAAYSGLYRKLMGGA